MGIAAALLIGVAAAFTRGQFWQFLKGKDGRYSNSQTQIALWFGAAMTAYLSLVFLRVYAGGLDTWAVFGPTANALALSGLGAITFGGAKIVTVAKNRRRRAGRNIDKFGRSPVWLRLLKAGIGQPILKC
jgi:hypothetical protein